ncbi:MAG: ABC transporter substrate-binding protein [Armatimonadota bacterium]|nr:ABC transporter substrate-binding protein [Armatimonadota bacterium]MDR7454266.1 ABC transporter substrate-binding protein [Armatimonadota bacterium]MDR7456784.1 ABC transporter substrate-binding protein [Armatimonadota bacterium]MDR7497344.1 ABC transporter substrate-binding protein [Armatimonadota bacterium]MDR7511726.1 ABC transporter substrate-binding protein [Armatimonadota bacterium]
MSSQAVRVALAIAVSLSVLGASAPGLAGPSAPQRGGIVRFGTAFEPARLNPTLYPSPADRQVTELVYNRLLKPDYNMRLVTDLAESYEISPDKLVITFKLRRGVRWHDGTPFTARDVAFTFRSLAHPNYAGGQVAFASAIRGARAYRERRASDVEGIRVLDDHTIQFTLEEVHGPALANFTHPIIPAHILGPVDPAQWDRHPTNVDRPVGTGPFKIVRVAVQQFVELEANPDYFGGRPNIDRFIWVLGDEAALLSSLLAGRIDAMAVPVTEARTVRNQRQLDIKEMKANTFFYMGFNMAHPLFRQKRVRQAFAHAIDRDEICRSALQGYCQVVQVPMAAPMWSFNPDAKGYAYDPPRARRILEELGWQVNPSTGIREKDGQRLQFEMVYSTPIMATYAPLIQQDLRAVGIGIDLVRLDWPTMVATKLLPRTGGQPRAPTAQELQTWLLFRALLLEPLGELHYGCDQQPPKGFNFTQYCNRQVDRLLKMQLGTMDLSERAAIYKRIMAILADDIPWIPLYSSVDLYGYNRRLQNFEPGVNGVTQNVTQWWIRR